jgi:3-deoxy-manno-octulosonate cytidylyltransferase (CMP-KDO synthetase)
MGHLKGMDSPATPPRPAPKKPIVLIPARMASTRLPGKPLADMNGAPMIVHVWRRAMEAQIGPVIVACAEQEIAAAIRKAGGEAILTNPDHPSGSDRIWEALTLHDPRDYHDAVINLQGDLPTIDPSAIRASYELLKNPETDIGTLAVAIENEADKKASQIVKAVFDREAGKDSGRALYFTRVPAPSGDGPLYHHVGIYAYRRDALARFVKAPPSPLEQREKLEQLRALSLGLRIDVAVINTVPLGVDTPEELEKARQMVKG